MTISYERRLRQLLESSTASIHLLPLFQSALEAENQGDLVSAFDAAERLLSGSLEYFRDVDPIPLLARFFGADLLARHGKLDQAVSQLAQVVNASVFAILSEMPEGNLEAAELIDLFFETCLCDPKLHPVVCKFAEDDEYLKTISNISSAVMNGSPKQAYFLMKAVFEVRKSLHAMTNEDTLLAAHKFAITLMTLGDYEAARSLSQQTFEQRKKLYGFDHILTLRAAGQYALALLKTGNQKEALMLQRAIYEKSREINGDEHQQTRIALNNLIEMQKGA